MSASESFSSSFPPPPPPPPPAAPPPIPSSHTATLPKAVAATTQGGTEYIKNSHQHTRTTNTATSAPASHKTLITDPGRSRRAPPSRPAPLDIELSSLPFAERASSHDPSHSPSTSHTSTTPRTYLLDGTPATGAPASYPTTDEDSQPLFPPQQHPPDNRGLAARLRAFMKDAYFPLLRSLKSSSEVAPEPWWLTGTAP